MEQYLIWSVCYERCSSNLEIAMSLRGTPSAIQLVLRRMDVRMSGPLNGYEHMMVG